MLFGALINPGANQTYLFRGERLGRWSKTAAHSSWRSAGTTIWRPALRSIMAGSTGRWSARAAEPAWATRASMTWLELGRHRFVFIKLRHCQHQRAVFAVAGQNDLSV